MFRGARKNPRGQNSSDRDKMAGNVSVIAFRSTEQIVAG